MDDARPGFVDGPIGGTPLFDTSEQAFAHLLAFGPKHHRDLALQEVTMESGGRAY